jgi:hypothetical protein
MTIRVTPGTFALSCPKCRKPLDLAALPPGENVCPHCSAPIDVMSFSAPKRPLHVARVSESGPDGSTACANHPRNVAVANCERCGLLICALCEMPLASARYCPACFERVTKEGSGETSVTFRDYVSLSRLTALIGMVLFFLGLPLGVASIYYGIRALRTRQESGARLSGILVSIVLGVVAMLWGGGLLAMMVVGAAGKHAS